MTTFKAPDGGGAQAARLSRLIAPPFYKLHRDIQRGGHTHYWLKGGRASGKSSFVSIEVVLGMMRHPDANAAVFRKVKETLRDSVYDQLRWAAQTLNAAPLWTPGLSPLSLTYAPTGQRIYFRGLDDPQKLKSLKPPHGYFRYIWFEELAEYDSMRQIRTVLQSVMRGGEEFRCFYTYNPPQSVRSWVNAAASEEMPGRMVHQSDYRGVPRDWLGEPFLIQAEHLRATRPETYRHEYLGEVTGTGTEVFSNLVFREIPEKELETLGGLCRGLDFGYASDPLHYAVCSYDAARRRLYIVYELHLHKTSNRTLAEKILAEMRLHGRSPVCCDSAEPKSIDDLYLLGVPVYGARKGQGSVEWGMRFLSQEVEQIIIDPARCPNTRREFYRYALDCDRDGNVIPQYPDRDNHSIDAVRYALETVIRARYAGHSAPPKEKGGC